MQLKSTLIRGLIAVSDIRDIPSWLFQIKWNREFEFFQNFREEWKKNLARFLRAAVLLIIDMRFFLKKGEISSLSGARHKENIEEGHQNVHIWEEKPAEE